ncbi:MAG: hypothetical protein ACYTGR_10050, partial [Planctomycetota bacterium]
MPGRTNLRNGVRNGVGSDLVVPSAGAVEAGLAIRTSERLQAEFRALIAAFPLEARKIVAMSEWLGVTQPVCQRLLRGVRSREDALTTLAYFPGVRGLWSVIAAARDRSCDEVLVAAAEAAVDQYASLIEDAGGSQARLNRLLRDGDLRREATSISTHGSPTPDSRRAGYDAARAATGRSYDAHVAVMIYRPLSGDRTLMESVTALGMIGIRRTPGCLPICPVKNHSHDVEAGMPDQEVNDGGIVPVEAFCSHPIPRLIARPVSGGLPVFIDPDRASPDPMDVVISSRRETAPHPRLEACQLEDCSLVSDGPARHLIISVHMHRSLARESIASAAAYAMGNRGPIGPPVLGPDGLMHPNTSRERWFDRLPDAP